ncbi:MAG TPA: hypothetical protein VH081_03295 [Solirubrobacteraceae bacterium]|jgi:hypothetical protein|nr:hypothetical protein [Solirubrobacteraceae bacterium]
MQLGARPSGAAAMGVASPAPAKQLPAAKQPRPRVVGPVVLVFLDAGERQLSSVGGLSIGLMSATQGAYFREQFLLDVGQGARVAASAYKRPKPPALLGLSGAALGAGAARQASIAFPGWPALVARARAVPQLLRPGLLASSIPGGAGYVGVSGTDDGDLIAAIDRNGRLAAYSSGSASTLLARVGAMRASKRLVVSDLPSGAAGLADLRALSRTRPAGELLLAVQRAAADGDGHELLWAGAAGLSGGSGGRELTSHTTNQRGLIASVDLAPSILERLGLAVPADMRGEPLETDGALDSAGLRAFAARLRVVGGRRLTAFGCLLAAWALLLLAASLLPAGRRRASRAWAMRVGGLAVLWIPLGALIGAALEPSAAVEYAAITLSCFALAAIADALLPWPRAPLLPVAVGVLALVIDALAGTQLLVRSLLGPNPILGARFYGFGNELKSGLAVAVLAAVAAALYPAIRSRRAAALTAAAGVVLAAIEGSARIGAGVGGVILVAAGFAVATLVLLPGSFSRGRALLVIASPLVALAALALLDLATAHGSGHFTGSILHARSAGDLRDVIVRRYGAAWTELKNHAMPYATALALLYAVLAVRRRARLLAPVDSDPAWFATLAGGLTAGVVGSFSEDSGPVLLVVAVFTLGCVASYLWGGDAGRSEPPAAAAAQRAALTASTEP